MSDQKRGGSETDAEPDDTKLEVVDKLPPAVKESGDAYSEILKRQNRLWVASMTVSGVIVANAFGPEPVGNIALPFGLGDTSPGAFYAFSTWILSILWFGHHIQYSQSTRAHTTLRAIVKHYSDTALAPKVALADIFDVFHASGPAHLSPLLASWSPSAVHWNWLRIPLKILVTITTMAVPPMTLVIGMLYTYRAVVQEASTVSSVVFWLVGFQATIVLCVSLANFVLLEMDYFRSADARLSDK